MKHSIVVRLIPWVMPLLLGATPADLASLIAWLRSNLRVVAPAPTVEIRK